MNDKVYIFTDGACRGNPGEGGWGAILQSNNHEKEINGYSENTTNNIMELTAVIKSLQALKKTCDVILTTDSKYVKNGITTWIHNWKKNGWKTASKKSVKNKELWILLDEECRKHKVTWEWIKGHSGHELNERADLLANLAIDNKDL
jgi:ribonuclease HI